MLNVSSLKLYKKFLVLVVLSTGLFIASSANQATSAQPCCSSCDPWYEACVESCQLGERGCIEANCDPYYNWCIGHCSDCEP